MYFHIQEPVLTLQCFIGSVINSKGSSHLDKVEKPLDSLYIPHMEGISEKFKHMWNTTLGPSSKLNMLLGVHS
jgi:hypothetical protein